MGKEYIFSNDFDVWFKDKLVEYLADLDTRGINTNQRVNDLITGVEQPSEVVDARGGFPVLSEHLNDIIENLLIKTGFALHVDDYGTIGDGIASDQTAIVNAVTDAYNQNKPLMWGTKTYLTTDNIPNFHSIKHLGNGIVKRGTDLFYISPKGTERNKIYTATSGGSNTFDGLSATQPIVKIQVAFDALANYAPVLTGFWEIVLTSGTYPFRAVLKDGLLSENPIEITGADVGGHPNVPTSIVSEGIGISAMGVKVSGGSKIKVKNVKFLGFNGSSSSAGINASNGSEVITDNVHADQCFYGISGQSSNIEVPNGIFSNCGMTNTGSGVGAAIRSLMLNRHAIGIQNAGVRTDTAIIKNCRYGVWAQESSTGHIDWVTFEDNEDGIVLRVNSRANTDGCLLTGNTRGIREDSNSHAFISGNTSFSDNGVNIVRQSGSQVTTSSIIDGVELSRSVSEDVFEIKHINQTINSTSNVFYHTVKLKAGMFNLTPSDTVLPKKMKFKVFGSLTGSNNNKRFYVSLGGLTGAVALLQFASTDSGTFEANGELYFTGVNAQYLFLSGCRHLGSPKQAQVNGIIDMSLDQNLDFFARVDDALDSIKIDMIEISYAG